MPPARLYRTALILLALAFPSPAQESAPGTSGAPARTEPADSPAPASDLLRSAVDPYLPQAERDLFIKAAGVDNDLDEEEFNASAKSAKGFVRVYDKWPALKRYDKNNDGKIDWQEANDYRQALRNAVIIKYDANRNKKLEGDERAAANRDLAAGHPPNIAIAVASTPPGSAPAPPRRQPLALNFGDPNAQFIPRFDEQGRLSGIPQQMLTQLGIDTDGDGLVSQDERLAAFNKLYNTANDALLKQFDKDGDGQISDSERAAMPTPVQFLLDIRDSYVHDYDDDGDGKLSPAEQKAIDEDVQWYLKVAEKNQLKMLDANHNGKIDPQEIQAMQSNAQAAVLSLLPKATAWVDADGDGQVSQPEALAAFDRFRSTFNQKIKDLRGSADADGDGRLNSHERRALMQKMLDDDSQRVERYMNSSGQLDSTGLARLYEDLAEEWGVKPPTRQ